MTLCGGFLKAQPLSLDSLFPYAPGQTAHLTSEAGFDMEVSGGADGLLVWTAAGQGMEGIRHTFQRSEAGLSFLTEEGVFPEGGVAYSETFNEPMLVLPAMVESPSSFPYAGGYVGSEFGDFWTGNAEGTARVEGMEPVETPFGTFDSVKISWNTDWSSMGDGFSSVGDTDQTWWVAPGLGVTRMDLAFGETYTEDGESETESFELSFTLVSGDLFGPPEIVRQPAGATVEEGAEVILSVEAAGGGG